jgi:hypothetical protein
VDSGVLKQGRCAEPVGRRWLAMPNLTQKNHYNPCFWTAHWNPQYYQAVHRKPPRPSARDQRVHVLSVKANKVYSQPVKDVHYDKDIGVAEVTLEAADDFCRRHHPSKYEDFQRKNRPEDYPVIIDFESLFEGLEKLPPYQVLLDIIRKNCITSNYEKMQIAHFVIYQRMRSHAVMNAVLDAASKAGREKFEPLIELKWMLSDTDLMYPQIAKLMTSRWKLYRLGRDAFPLSDSAVLLRPGNIMVTLSPRLLLEVDLRGEARGCNHYPRIDDEKLAEFRERTIGGTFREIIFSDPATLEDWRIDPAFQERVEFVRSLKDYDGVVLTTRDFL